MFDTAASAYDTTTTTYDAAGRVATVTDPKGSTTTSWDGADANGAPERRGLATRVTVTRVGQSGATLDFTGAYDADGALTTQVLPGGITQTTTYDTAGEPTELRYQGQVTPVTGYDQEGNPTYGAPTTGTWLTWSQDNDITGRVRNEYTDSGSSFDPANSGVTSLDQVVAPTGQAFAYDRAYTYDAAGRLSAVTDRTATATGITLDPGTDPTTAAPCSTRAYTFDNNGRRTALQEVQHPDGDCDSAGGTSVKDLAYAYDSADRPTTAATGTSNGNPTTAGTYAYDGFGRQTLIPATDAPTSAAGDITLGYYDDDLARTITQNNVTTTLDLDSGGRRVKSTTVNGATTTVLERHYADGSDNPAWTVKNPGPGAAITRYAESLGGDLSATINADGSADLPLATLHGDVVTTIDIPATQATGTPATSITGWSDYTEYGAPRDTTATDTIDGDTGYGWLGAKQRSTTPETAGLTLMGDRLYNAITGRFTSTDPEPGGNATAYSYPTDPINMFDLDGHWGSKKFWHRAKWIAGAAAFGACVFLSAGVCAVAGVAAAGIAAREKAGKFKSWSFAKEWGKGALWAVAGAGVGKAIGMAYKAGGQGVRAARYGRHMRYGGIGKTRNYVRYGERSAGRLRGPHWSYYKAQVGMGFAFLGASNARWRRNR